MLSAPQALESLHDTLRDTWAQSTLTQRQHLWHRYRAWCTRERQAPSSPESAVLFILATRQSPQTMLTYGKIMSAIFGRMGWPRLDISNLLASLRLQGAEVPIHQAVPIPRQTLETWARSQPNMTVRICCFLAWKTASRWDDVSGLQRHNFILCTPTEIIIDWSTVPKGRRRNPYKPSKYTVVVGRLTNEIAAHVWTMNARETLCPKTTSAIDTAWKSDPMMAQFTCHSIKRGALTHLIELGSTCPEIDPTRISLLAKHEHIYDLAAGTIRYSANPIATARLLRTQDVTRLL